MQVAVVRRRARFIQAVGDRAGCRPPEVVALRPVAGAVAQELRLLGRLHAFGHYGKGEFFAHGDGRLGQFAVFRAVFVIRDHAAVDVDRVEAEFFRLDKDE